VAHFVLLLFEGNVGAESFSRILCFSLSKRLIGKLLLHAICFMDSDSSCHFCLSGSVNILSMWNL